MRRTFEWLGLGLIVAACSGGRSDRVPSDRLTCRTDAECEDGECVDGLCREPQRATGSVRAVSRAEGADVEIQHQLVGDEQCTQGEQSVCTLTPGATVIWRAPEVEGFRFAGWSGDEGCESDQPVLELSVERDVECIASYVKRWSVRGELADGTGQVAVSSEGAFATCADGGCVVDAQAEVTLEAPQRDGRRLTGWEGQGCPNEASSRIRVVANADLVCRATYVEALTVRGSSDREGVQLEARSESANASCDVALCAVDPGSAVTLVAPAVEGARFAGWNGDAACSGSEPTLIVSDVRNNVSCMASYVQRQRVTGTSEGAEPPPAIVASSEDAFASCDGASCEIDVGGSVTLSAPTVPGMRLRAWSGEGCQAGNGASARAADVRADVTCTAQYVEGVAVIGTVIGLEGVVRASSDSAGADCTAGQCVVDIGGTVTLSAPIVESRTFLGWEGDEGCSGREPTLVIADVRSSTSCSARYAARYQVEGTVSGGGRVRASSPSVNAACQDAACEVDQGATVVLEAVSDDGARFTGWSGGGACTGSEPRLTLGDVQRNQSCRANFVRRFRISGQTAPSEAGSVAATSLSGAAECGQNLCTVDAGADVALLASAGPAYRFTGWSGCTESALNPLLISDVQASASCDANYALRSFEVRAASSAGGMVAGEVGGAPCALGSCTVPYGGSVSFEAIPARGYGFVGWRGCSDSVMPVLTLDGVTANATCMATFSLMSFVVTLSANEGGSVSLSAEGGSCEDATCTVGYGGSVTLRAEADDGHRFVGFSDCVTTAEPSATLSGVMANRRCVATFEPLRYPVVARAESGGSVNCTGDGCSVAHGQGVELRAEPAPGYDFAAWRCTPTSAAATSARFTLNSVTQPYTCVASFTPTPRTATARVGAGGGGTVTCAQGCTVPHGSPVTLEARPDARHTFERWTCSPAVASAPASLTIPSLTQDVSCEATFTPAFSRVTLTNDGGHANFASFDDIGCDNADCPAVPRGADVGLTIELDNAQGARLFLVDWGCPVVNARFAARGETLVYSASLQDVSADVTCNARFALGSIVSGATSLADIPAPRTTAVGAGYCGSQQLFNFCIVPDGGSVRLEASASAGVRTFSGWNCAGSVEAPIAPDFGATHNATVGPVGAGGLRTCSAQYQAPPPPPDPPIIIY